MIINTKTRPLSKFFLPISRVKPYPQDTICFCRQRIWWLAVSNFQVPMRCNVWKTENICSWKKFIVLRKKPKMFPLTWPQSQCILVIALLVLFRLSVLFSNTKNLSVILNFRKQSLIRHVQRSTFTKRWKQTAEQTVTKKLESVIEDLEGVWLA